MDLLHWILTAITTLFGGTSFYTILLYRKQEKRAKNAEAFGKEVTALQTAQGIYEKQLESQSKRIDELQKQLTNQDARMRELREDNNILEIKHAKNKSAINKAYSCTFCPSTGQCPVLVQRAINEEDYVKQIEKRNVDSNRN